MSQNEHEWSLEDLQHLWNDIREIGVNKFNLSFYEPAFEIITFEDMLKIYSTNLPICYDHWSFGQSYVKNYEKYRTNVIGIASEVIFNTNPALCYLLNNNSYALQALVIAHAAIGHSSFCANNYLFKEHTSPDTILPFLKQFKNTIKQYEVEYGADNVEEILDCCHALSLNAITHTKKRVKKSDISIKLKRFEEEAKDISRISNESSTIKASKNDTKKSTLQDENLVLFIAQHSPNLTNWQRDILVKYCQTQQYLFPQMLTKIMNEGWATFWQVELLEELYNKGKLTDGQYIESIDFLSKLITQPDNRQFNPYALGYAIFSDIKRICTEPNEEDRQWFPDLVDTNWMQSVRFAMENFKDSSFILQYLSPKVIRDFNLYSIFTTETQKDLQITEIQDDNGYKKIRQLLSEQVDLTSMVPNIYVEGWDRKKTRALFLVVRAYKSKKFSKENLKVWKYIKKLWSFPIYVKVYNDDKFVEQVNIDTLLKGYEDD